MLLAVFGALNLWCWWQIRLLGDVRLQLGAFYAWYGAAFGWYLSALWLVRRDERRVPAIRMPWAPLAVIGAIAVVCRLILLPTTPTLSDDIYRYVWDGRMQLAGIDPYAYPPNHLSLAHLRDELWSTVNFPHLRTVYPPLTELAFRLGAWMAPTLTAQKVVFLSAELVIAGCLLFVLSRRRLSPLWVVAYAWHPLPILEIAGSGHNDTLGVAMLWVGIAAWQAGSWGGCAVGWAGAFLSKFSSIVMAPWWWCRRRARWWLGAFLLLATLPFAIRWSAVTAVFESLSAMTVRFEANSSVYLLLASLIHQPGVARVVVVALWVGWVLWWAKREEDPVRYFFGVMGMAVLLSPVVHPWYLVWIVPCVAIWRPPALVAFTATVVLSYAAWPGYLAGISWEMPAWARVIEYTPVFLLGLWEVRRRWWLRSSFLPATKPRPLVTS